jgi:Na+/proline symporter
MQLETIDWIIVAGFFAAIVCIGILASRQAGRSSANFFLGGRTMPWWLLGVSMVACTFSCDTPNLVTDLVRGDGVVANWAWWAFLITGMVTVFIYAQLWRRSKVMTDLEFYELRYSGKSAAFIRGFRAIYLGIFFNCLIMGSVTLAAIKIGQVIFGVDPWVAVVLGSAGVVIYATIGGIKSCIWADFFQYSIAMFGAVYAAVVACQQPEIIGGLSGLLTHENVVGKLSWMPDFSTWLAWVPLLLIPVAVQWWAVWYPGAEPGGGGYIAQRMLAAKDEKNAIGATMFFNFMHYAIRPWPWIIVALASLVCYPSLAQIKAEFPSIDPTYLKQDIAYPVMISKLGPGLLGLVVASLIAAYMSTIGTHLNWGSSYAVNDFYKRFIRPHAGEKELVKVARICTVLLMVLAAFFALTLLESAGQAFQILLLSGAGTGAIYILRWFWWRINAWTEIVAMVVATIAAFWIVLGVGNEGTYKWYVGSSAVSDNVIKIEKDELAKNIIAEQKAASEENEKLTEEVESKVTGWRKAQKTGLLARDRARLLYDDALQAQEDHNNATTAIALLKNQGDLDYDNRMKPKAEIVDILAENKTTYEAVAEKFTALKTDHEAAETDTKNARKVYAKVLGQAMSYDDAELTEARVALTKAVEQENKTDKDFKDHFAKYGITVVTMTTPLSEGTPVWFTSFNDFVGIYGDGVKAIVVGDVVYVYDPQIEKLKFPVQLLVCVIVVTITWLLTTLVTPAVDKKTLRSFYKLCHPGGPGWRKVVQQARDDGEEIDQKNSIGDWKLPIQILCIFLGCVTIYSSLFSIGNFVYGNTSWGVLLIVVAAVSVFALFKCFGKIGTESSSD